MKPSLPDAPFDPKLKLAAEEIKAVLRKYDIAGMINLQSPPHGEFVRELTPSWSCLTVHTEPDGRTGVRFKANIKSGPRTESLRAELTAGMICSFRNCAKRDAYHMGNLEAMIKEHLDFDHIESKIRPHNPKDVQE